MARGFGDDGFGVTIGDFLLDLVRGETRDSKIERIYRERQEAERLKVRKRISEIIAKEKLLKEKRTMANTKDQPVTKQVTKKAPSEVKAQPKREQPKKVTNKKTGDKGGLSALAKQGLETVGDVAMDQAVGAIQDASRVTYPYNRAISASWPQSVDLYHYGYYLTPAGDSTGSDSIARAHFKAALGPKILSAVRQSLTYGPAVAITTDDIADYINSVSVAYFHLLAIREHMRLCYYSHTSSLSLRFDLIYDETIPPAHIRLANALSAMYLPRRVKALIEQLARTYVTDQTPLSPVIQFVPYISGFNNAASYTAAYTTQITAVENAAKRDDLNTAFSNRRFPEIYGPMERLELEEHRVPELFLHSPPSIVYNEEILDAWLGIPLEAADAVPTTRRHTVADTTTTIVRLSVGSKYTKLSNVLVPNYITANSRYEPGITTPVDNVSGANDNNFRIINVTGQDGAVDITNVNSTAHGVLARSANQCYNTTTNYRMRPAGTTYSYTNMSHIASDTYEVMDILFG